MIRVPRVQRMLNLAAVVTGLFAFVLIGASPVIAQDDGMYEEGTYRGCYTGVVCPERDGVCDYDGGLNACRCFRPNATDYGTCGCSTGQYDPCRP